MDDNRLDPIPAEATQNAEAGAAPENTPPKTDAAAELSKLPEIELPGAESAEKNAEEDTRTDFQKKVAKISEKTWKRILYPSGVALGVIVLYFLFVSDSEESSGLFSMSSLIALIIALFIPKSLEQSCGRSLNQGRIAMVITIGVGLVIRIIITGMQHGFSLT